MARTIPEDPGTWEIEDVRAAAETFAPEPYAAINRLFYDGDHWQAGAGWIGPFASAVDQPREFSKTFAEIARQFCSRNAIKEVTERHRNALTSRTVDLRITPKEQQTATAGQEATEAPEGELVAPAGRQRPAGQEDATAAAQLAQPGALPLEPEPEPADPEIDLLHELLTNWLDRADTSDAIQDAITALLLTRRAALRFYVPPTVLDENDTIRPQEEDRALDAIYLESPPDGRAGIFSHKVTRRRVAIFIDPEGTEAGTEYAEIAWRDPETDLIEIVQFEEGNRTNRLSIPMTRLPGHGLEEPQPLITEQIRAQQRALNLSETMRARNVVTAGFLERTLLNAQVDGRITRTADGAEKYTPPDITWGAGVTNVFTGVRTRGQNGLDMVADPQLIYRDPVDVETFNKSSDQAYANILAEAHQLHYMIADDATASGTSRITAMADHITAVLQTKQKVDLALTWIVEAAAGYIELLTGQPGRWSTKYQISAEARLEFGPIAPSMISAAVNASRNKLLSRRTAMGWIGVEDPEEEEKLIREEQESPLALQAGMANQLGEISQLLSRTQQQRRSTNGQQPSANQSAGGGSQPGSP